MTSDDVQYYRGRAVEERAMALRSDRQNVREIHEELARQYESLVVRGIFAAPCPGLGNGTPNLTGLFRKFPTDKV